MAKPYTISITNGVGTGSVLNDNYSVTASVTGYDDTTIDPATLSVVEGTNDYALTIGATGTLTLHVTEDGTTTGTAVVGAKFYRCDSNGTTYGDAITSDAQGDAVFNNVPYAADGAPLIYYKQTESDGDHEFDDTLQNTSLSTESSTIEVQNSIAALRTFTVTDTNYANLPIGTGTINLS